MKTDQFFSPVDTDYKSITFYAYTARGYTTLYELSDNKIFKKNINAYSEIRLVNFRFVQVSRIAEEKIWWDRNKFPHKTGFRLVKCPLQTGFTVLYVISFMKNIFNYSYTCVPCK